MRFGSRKIPGFVFFLPARCLVLFDGRDSYQMFQMSPKTPLLPVLRGSKGSPVICGRRKRWLWLSLSSPPLVLRILVVSLLPWPVALLAAGLTAARDYAVGEKESKAEAN